MRRLFLTFNISSDSFMKMKIFIVENQYDTLNYIEEHFEKERHVVKRFDRGHKAYNSLERQLPDAIVCDWHLEDIDGLELCRKIKKCPSFEEIPFFMISSKNQEIDIVTALEVGADDYLVKPVKIRELLVRLKKACLKSKLNISKSKNEYYEQKDIKTIFYKGITIDDEYFSVTESGNKVELSTSEFKLLRLLALHPGRVYSRSQIIESLNGPDYGGSERSIDVLISSLRKKIATIKSDLINIRGVGYKLKN